MGEENNSEIREQQEKYMTETDNVIINYLQFMFEDANISKETILSVYKGAFFHAASRTKQLTKSYKEIARRASILSSHMLYALMENEDVVMEDEDYEDDTIS